MHIKGKEIPGRGDEIARFKEESGRGNALADSEGGGSCLLPSNGQLEESARREGGLIQVSS